MDVARADVITHNLHMGKLGRLNHERRGSRGESPSPTENMNTLEIEIIEEGGLLRFNLEGPGNYANAVKADCRCA